MQRGAPNPYRDLPMYELEQAYSHEADRLACDLTSQLQHAIDSNDAEDALKGRADRGALVRAPDPWTAPRTVYTRARRVRSLERRSLGSLSGRTALSEGCRSTPLLP